MAKLVKWCLCISYFYGRFTGVINFEIDLKTGRTRITNAANILSVCAQVFLFSFLVFQGTDARFFNSFWSGANILHKTVYQVMGGFRFFCILLAIVSRWWQRQRFIQLFKSFRCLVIKNPEIIENCRLGIVSKCFCATITELLMLAMGLEMMWDQLTFFLVLDIWAVTSLAAIINIIVTQHYIALAVIRGRYILLNNQLGRILDETNCLNPQRSGVFMTKCCDLADRLDEIGENHTELQSLTDRLFRTYDVQVLCMSLTYYLSVVGGTYLAFSLGKHQNFIENWSQFFIGLAAAFLVFFLTDCLINAHNAFSLLSIHSKIIEQLKQRQQLWPGLDVRLETAFENFQLNLARKPYRLQLFGAFNLEPQTFLSTANSLLINSIFLIQYDVENY